MTIQVDHCYPKKIFFLYVIHILCTIILVIVGCLLPILFISFVSSSTIPKSVNETLDHPGMGWAKIVEIQGFKHNKTCELVPLPSGKKTIGCCWVYVIKVGTNCRSWLPQS